MSRQDSRRFVIAYDVVDDNRRARLARVLEQFGDRVQYSVFVADLGAARMIMLRAAVSDVIRSDQDSVLMCDLGPSDDVEARRFTMLGRRRSVTPRGSMIL